MGSGCQLKLDLHEEFLYGDMALKTNTRDGQEEF